MYEDFPQTISQHSQAEESHHDSRAIGDKLNVDHIFNNDGKSEMILEVENITAWIFNFAQ